LRLVPAALGSWAVVILALLGGPVLAAVLAAVTVLVAAAAGRRSRRRPDSRRAAGVLLATAAAGAAGLVAAAQLALVAAHPVRQAAAEGSAATVHVVVSEEPAPIRSTGYAGRQSGVVALVVPVRLLAADFSDEHWSGGGRLVLITPPEGWSELVAGSTVVAHGLLEPADRPDLTVAVLRVRGTPEPLDDPPWWQRGAATLRDGLRAAAATLPDEPRALLPGLAVGDTSGMSPSARAEFRTSGLSHLVAVSGMNVIIVCGAVLGLLWLLRVGPRGRAVGAAVALFGFVVLAGPSPSVLRAAVMGGVGFLALLLGRGRSALPALAAAVIGLLLVDPALALDPGFALSVLATAALVTLAPGWAAALRRRGVPPGVAEMLAVPAAAHVVTAPVIAGLSGQVSLVAVVANLLAAPVVATATVLGVLAALVSPVSPPAAAALVGLARPPLDWLLAVAHRSSAVPGAALAWPAGAPGALLLVVVLLALLLVLRIGRMRALAAAVVVGALVVLLPTRLAPPGWPAAGWAVVACDVGQGDAVVLATGQPGRAVVVDTGPEPGPVDDCLGRLGVTSLALVVLSHLHVDHVGGLEGAVRDRAVAAVAVGPAREPAWALRRVERTATSHRVPLTALTSGQRLTWPGLSIDVIAPRQAPASIDPNDGTAVNDGSLVLRATTVVGTVLLTGDVELLGQSDLLTGSADLHADVLKVPHHGSRYSVPAFLAAVRPRVALVSVGAGNSYGHPSTSVLAALSAGGALVRRTDEAGDVAVVGDQDGPAVVARGEPRAAVSRRVRRGRPRSRPRPSRSGRARRPRRQAS
jgi:competence protein ComEC